MHREASPYREVTPFDGDLLDDYISRAHEYHDKLVELGGRPTRSVLEQPTGKAIHLETEIRILDDHGELQGTIAADENLTLDHWTRESARFQEELEQWEGFRDYQSRMESKPLLRVAFDSGSTDLWLVETLTRLNDWREFQNYQQVKVGKAAMSTWSTTRYMARIRLQEAESDDPSSYKSDLTDGFEQLFTGKGALESSQTKLTWIKGQVSDLLSEACASSDASNRLQLQLELKLEEQAVAFDQELRRLEARTDPPLQSPRDSADSIQRICHWASEVTRLIDEHWEWKIFLKWRRMQPHAETTEDIDDSSSLRIWVDFVSYRRHELARVRSWTESWERLLLYNEHQVKTTSKEQGLAILEGTNVGIRADIHTFQQDIHSAELQLRSAEQLLVKLRLEESRTPPFQNTRQKKRRMSSRVLKNTAKKSVRKPRTLKERQVTALPNAISSRHRSPADRPTLRRSQRLKDKASTLA